jgi:hypothetical protein
VTRRKWLTVCVAIGGAAVVFFAVPATRHLLTSPSSSKWVEVAHGARHGVFWRLDIAEQDGQLCMSVDGAGGPSDPVHAFSGACGFVNDPNGAGFYYASGLGPADDDVNFGPLPSTATHIRVASNLVLPTHPLPHVDGMASGRWWFELVSRDGSPAVGEGHVLDTPQPLDDAGHLVLWKEF